MRINAGKWKGRNLYSVEGLATRPTPDMMKQALFNIIGDRINNSSFCDVFAGTGNVAFEALSRGAKSAVVIENSRPALNVIRQNAEKLGCARELIVMSNDAVIALNLLKGREFNFIFIDPPYNMGFEQKVLEAIEQNGLLAENGMVIVQFEAKRSIVDIVPDCYELVDERKYGRSSFIMLKKVSDSL